MNVPTIKEKLKLAYPKLKEKYGYKNVMQAPKIEKILISVGTGKMSRADKKRQDFVASRLAIITGQKPSSRPAKKSIASFKMREGEIIGQLVTTPHIGSRRGSSSRCRGRARRADVGGSAGGERRAPGG